MEKYSKELLEINKRFVEAVELLNRNSNKVLLLNRLGYKTTRQYYNIVNNQSLVSTSALYNLSKKYFINPFWLFHGKGDMMQLSDDLIAKQEDEKDALMVMVKRMIKINNDLTRDKRLMSDMLTKQVYGEDAVKELSDEDAVKEMKKITEGN